MNICMNLCWLIVMVSWLSCVTKYDSCSLSVICFSDFSKQSSTHAVFNMTSGGGSFTFDRGYSLTWLLHSSTAILTSANQSSLNKGSSGVSSSITWPCKFVSLLWAFNTFSCENFNFDKLPCSSMSFFIWLIFVVMIDFFLDLFLFNLPIASSLFWFNHWDLITPFTDNCSIWVTLKFTKDYCSFIYKNVLSQNLIDNNYLHNFKCLVISYWVLLVSCIFFCR